MKSVYFFDEGDSSDRKLLGGKGAGLCEMTSLGLPVPPGFVITTDVCKSFYKGGRRVSPAVLAQVRRAISRLEKQTGRRWNSADNPLLVSVRSGAAVSMPGMMDTILNLGINDRTVQGLARESSDERFAWDSYRRFVQLFGKVVLGVDDSKFERVLEAAKRRTGAKSDGDLDARTLQGLVSRFKAICEKHTGKKFPSDPYDQLKMAVHAVFDSWMGERAVVYRKNEGITQDMADGTAVNVQAMVFGNMGIDSATGVVFTRDPGNGQRRLYGEYLINAQGEDVVAGTRTPKPIALMRGEMPAAYAKLEKICAKLEGHYREPQDLEFTVERGRFYMLQTRAAKTNAIAMVKFSVDMVREGMITKKDGLLRINLKKLEQLLHPTLDEETTKNIVPIASGIAASPGASHGDVVFDVGRAVASGTAASPGSSPGDAVPGANRALVSGSAVFNADRAVEMGGGGKSVILVREETKPEDVPAFYTSVGILTSKGGKSSHAAVVARGMGKPCIVGTSDMRIDYQGRRCTAPGGTVIEEGDPITIDGSSGAVYRGRLPLRDPGITPEFRTLLEWAKRAMRIGVRANADTPEAAAKAREHGARGIGLCRTERMFNEEGRIGLFQDMIMAASDSERRRLLKRLRTMQRRDFEKILSVMQGYPVTIRLLDPPLHEFLRAPEILDAELRGMRPRTAAGKKGRAIKAQLDRARELAEVNPMMGHRGVRVGITYPEIYETQIEAVFDAAISLRRQGITARPQIMVPQVGSASELDFVRKIFDKIAARKRTEPGGRGIRVAFGTMVEVVRGALTAGDLVGSGAEFFSFGTNDLTQATYSFSREDAEGKFLQHYYDANILDGNPFESLDPYGVGRLMQIAVEDGRRADAGLEIGICGEHGGDPESIKFCHGAGISYVSASAHRIPIAIVAAAQAALKPGTASAGKAAATRKRRATTRTAAGKRAAATRKRRAAAR